MNIAHLNSTNAHSRAFQMREAALMLFRDPAPAEHARLLHLSNSDWQNLLRWLDTSGLALYLLDRVEELGLSDSIPLPVIERLRQNLADNSQRMAGMVTELLIMHRCFQESGVPYAVLKGFSLWPISVSKLELRSQLDLDFLVAEEDSLKAWRVLEDAGYRLNAIAGENGKTWEFESGEYRASSLNGLYKAGMRRSADLHLEPASAQGTSRLSRAQQLHFHGIHMPVLSPVDLFLGQALHVYQHVCCEFMRAAHLLEFYRHVTARQNDDEFWSQLHRQVGRDPETCVRLGIVILLITRVMGDFAPHALTWWTVGQLSPTAHLWVDRYGHRVALASFPGTKLYLLLQEEMRPVGLAAKRTRMAALLPLRLPPVISRPVAGETFSQGVKRFCVQLRFFFFRLRFHVLEGIRYFHESILWQQYRNGVSQ